MNLPPTTTVDGMYQYLMGLLLLLAALFALFFGAAHFGLLPF